MSSLNLHKIGVLLKNQRLSLGYSIRDLSSLSGVAAGTISQIETGKTSPNLVSVHALCETLGFPISALFVEENSDQIKLVRKNERSSFVRNTSNGREILETLITKGDSQMWGGHVVMPAETDSGAFYYHDGEELVYMLSGVLVFELEGHAPYTLQPGDTLYYPNEIGHRWENQTGEAAEFLIISTSDFKKFEESAEGEIDVKDPGVV